MSLFELYEVHSNDELLRMRSRERQKNRQIHGVFKCVFSSVCFQVALSQVSFQAGFRLQYLNSS
jgi:hypothetical protein